ncbi:CRYAB-like protein [Mya arenaria]|uniref:CRYAB-like protein n=1 Tax=Mya arenaria TaxID=6604 RepID=A0ABY7DNJ9_MYAAR|nr:CRYAB-like protein [Mya arenaria]
MFHKMGNLIRPACHATRLGRRSLCSKRNIPVEWRRGDLWSDFFKGPLPFGGPWRHHFREMEDAMRAMEKQFDRMSPRAFGESFYRRPTRLSEAAEEAMTNQVSKVRYDGKAFEVTLDVKNFSPSELEVRLSGGRLTVHGKHEQRADEHGYEVDAESFESSVSEEGLLTIRANVKTSEQPVEKKIEVKTAPGKLEASEEKS